MVYIKAKNGKIDKMGDFTLTNLTTSKTRDTILSETFTDRNKLTIDQNDDIAMSNLNKLRTHYNESPEDFVKNHPDLIATYGIGKNVLENFKSIVGVRSNVKSFLGKQEPDLGTDLYKDGMKAGSEFNNRR